MAYREVTMIEVKEVLRQWLSGLSRKAMVRWVGLDRNTIRRYLQVAQQCGLHAADGVDALTDEKLSEVLAALGAGPGRPHGEGWAICERHREKIAGFIKDRIRLTKARKLLLRQGIDVSYPTLHRFAISELGFGKRRLTIPVADCGPGEELQLDTGRMGLLEPGEDGKRRRFKAFIFTSVLTRHRFVYPVFTEQTADAIEACEVAWEYFGGIFRVIIPDNTKAIVNIPDPLDPVINIAFQEYSQHRGFFIDPARVRAPQDKGRIERPFAFIENNFYPGRTFADLADLNRQMEAWCEKVNARGRRHLGGAAPVTLFRSEKPYLLPLPVYVPEVYALHPRVVDLEGMVNLHNNRYSVPEDLIGRQVEVRETKEKVTILSGHAVAACHDRMEDGAGRRCVLPEHRYKGRAHRKGDLLPPLPEEKILLGQGGELGVLAKALREKCGRSATRALRHLHRMYLDYPGDALKKAATMALAHGLFDTQRIERMVLRSIAGEFFQLPLPPEPGKEEDPGGHGEKKTGEDDGDP